MRIAHLTWSMGIGGTQTMLVGIVNGQVQEGHEVGIFVVDTYVSRTIVNKLDPRVKVLYMGRVRGTKPIWPFIKLNWLLWKFKPDIVHSHAGKLSKAILTQAPMVATIHSMNNNPDNYKKYKKCFAISEAVKKDFKEKGIDNVLVIENGIPCGEITPKKDFCINDTIHVVQVSRIIFSPKRQDLVVQALAKVNTYIKDNKELKGKRVVIHFVGDGLDMPKLKALVSDLKLEEDVVFEGFKDRNWVFDHLCDYDLFLQPSDFEGFGLTVAEACAAKLPVLVSDVDGPLEVIDNGRLGMVFNHGDADDLKNQLIKFMEGGYNYQLIEPAYRNTLQKYDVKRTTARYLEEYAKVVGM